MDAETKSPCASPWAIKHLLLTQKLQYIAYHFECIINWILHGKMSIGLFPLSESLFCKSGLRQLVEALLLRDLKLGLLRGSAGSSLWQENWMIQAALSFCNFILWLCILVSCHFFSRLSSITPNPFYLSKLSKSPMDGSAEEIAIIAFMVSSGIRCGEENNVS